MMLATLSVSERSVPNSLSTVQWPPQTKLSDAGHLPSTVDGKDELSGDDHLLSSNSSVCSGKLLNWNDAGCC